jgi:hypothetical protein
MTEGRHERDCVGGYIIKGLFAGAFVGACVGGLTTPEDNSFLENLMWVTSSTIASAYIGFIGGAVANYFISRREK